MTTPTRHAIAAETIFDGETLRRGYAVIVEGAEIVSVVPRGELPAIPVCELPEGSWLAPGFIDTQVNGGGDRLFNDAPTAETIAAIVAAHRRFGTTGMLPTLISDSAARMRDAADAVDAAAATMPGVLGIHFEGPFLSPERAGIHNPALFRQPGPDDFALLTARRRGVTLTTLAPERVPGDFIEGLARAGGLVALGHSMATYTQTRTAMEAGLSGFTHLFNAMRPMLAREPGPIAAAIEDKRAFFGLIVDGVHVAPAMLRLALHGAGQAMLVTDAMPPVGGTRLRFTLSGRPVEVHDGCCTAVDGTLAGSVLDMASAVRNCVRLLDLPLSQALRMASTVPATFLGLGDRLGKLMPGYRADLVALDPAEVRVLATWVAGESDTQAVMG